LSLPMMAAWMLSQAPLPPRMGTILATGAVIAIPTALILAQPDFGTAMLVVASGVFALYLAGMSWVWFAIAGVGAATRSEEHTSELQSRENLVCRLLLEKKK